MKIFYSYCCKILIKKFIPVYKKGEGRRNYSRRITKSVTATLSSNGSNWERQRGLPRLLSVFVLWIDNLGSDLVF